MFAIVESSGRQHELVPGRYIDIDMTAEEEGTTHVFENVLMLVDGDAVTVGKPYVAGAKVTGKVVSKLEVNPVHGRIQSSIKDNKIIVYHMKPKKGTRKKQGHRTQFTRIMIDSIEHEGKTFNKEHVKAKPEAPKKEFKAKVKETKGAKSDSKQDAKKTESKKAEAKA